MADRLYERERRQERVAPPVPVEEERTAAKDPLTWASQMGNQAVQKLARFRSSEHEEEELGGTTMPGGDVASSIMPEEIGMDASAAAPGSDLEHAMPERGGAAARAAASRPASHGRRLGAARAESLAMEEMPTSLDELEEGLGPRGVASEGRCRYAGAPTTRGQPASATPRGNRFFKRARTRSRPAGGRVHVERAGTAAAFPPHIVASPAVGPPGPGGPAARPARDRPAHRSVVSRRRASGLTTPP